MHLVADLHLHTIASGHAYSTIKENLCAARSRGLQMVAITDHGPSLPGGPDISYFGYLQILPDKEDGVEILVGVEANILDIEGSLDLSDRYLSMLDIVLAGFHPPCYESGTREENTRALVNTIKNPLVDVIVHPGNPAFPIDFEEFAAACKENNCALEINNSSLSGGARHGSCDNCLQIARAAAREGVLVSVGSDAHYTDRVGCFDAVLDLLDRAGISEDQVLNTSVDKVKNFLRGKGKLGGHF